MKNWYSMGWRYGLYAGLGVLLFYFGLYFYKKEWVADYYVYLGFAIILAAKNILAGRIYSSITHHQLEVEVRVITGSLFRISVLSVWLWVGAQFLLINMIDPDLQNVLKQKTIEMTVQTMESLEKPQHEINNLIKKIEQESFALSVSDLLQRYIISLIFGFIFSIVMAYLIYLLSKPFTRTGEPGQEPAA